jgi:hypothetical protein
MPTLTHSLSVALLAGTTILAACGQEVRVANTEADAKTQPAVAPVADPAAPSSPPSTPPPLATTRSSEPLDVRVRFHEEVADSTHPTEFQSSRLVGHYSTPNGKVGFVLDRTADPPKIRLDGDRYVLVLSPRQASKGWLELVASNIWIRIDEGTGRILSFSGPGMQDSSSVVRDADARPLAAAK